MELLSNYTFDSGESIMIIVAHDLDFDPTSMYIRKDSVIGN